MSAPFASKVFRLCRAGHMAEVKQWFFTADGVVMPLLLTCRRVLYKDVDRLTKWSLEWSSNNYALFIRNLKKVRKIIRKSAMLGELECRLPPKLGFMNPYVELYNRYLPKSRDDLAMQYGLIWSQTRASGLADSRMEREAVTKFASVVDQPHQVIHLRNDVLGRCVWRASFITGKPARISSGPSSCLESTRQQGGLTGELSRICQEEQIDFHYDGRSMERVVVPRHKVSSAQDVLDYCIERALTQREETLTVRVHTVREPSKARVITVGSFAYHAIMDIFAHVWHSVCASGPVRSGMTSTRHMWNFVHDNLDPSSPESSNLWVPRSQRDEGNLWALSTDLETCTDYANPTVGIQIWDHLILASRNIPGFPVELAHFAKGLFFSDRPVLYEGKPLCTKRRGWLMGDPMTKVLLTIAQEYAYRLVEGPHVGSMVGDDLVVISNSRGTLRTYLRVLESLDFRVSEDDTVISCRYMFYCEECARVPQRDSDTVRAHQKRGDPLLGYVDYPRIRLILPVRSEINRSSYTDQGRFSLLGKETRWTCLDRKAGPLTPAMVSAGYLQHILLWEEKGLLAPYFPEELGGDGSYHPHPGFIRQIWAKRSPDLREVYYRAKAVMSGKLTFRFCRTDKPGHYGHQYRNWITYAQMDEAIGEIPPEAVIVPETPAHRHLLECLVAHKRLVTPDVAFLQLETARYYRCILQGFGVPEMDLYARVPHLPSGAGRSRVSVPGDLVEKFLRQWRNPGFNFRNHPPYFVRQDELQVVRYLNLGWNWRPLTEPPGDLMDLSEKEMNQLIQYVSTGHSVLDRTVLDRLPLYMESDNLLSILIGQCPSDRIRLVTADLRLAHRLRGEYPLKEFIVVHPLVDLLGVETPRTQGYERVADPGALEFHTYAWFEDGLPTIPCNLRLTLDWVLKYNVMYYHYVWSRDPDGFLSMFTDKVVSWEECPPDFKVHYKPVPITIGGKAQRGPAPKGAKLH
jgi:hypothetical protein